MNERLPRPRYTGVHIHKDAAGRFQFEHPSDWTVVTASDEAWVLRPDPEDEATHFGIWVERQPMVATAADVSALSEGFDHGLAELPELRVESATDSTYHDIIKLERVVIFADDSRQVRRKSRIWAIYADDTRYVVSYQGSTTTEYDYWLAMGNNCFWSFQLPMSLWFATDPATATFPTADDAVTDEGAAAEETIDEAATEPGPNG